VDPGGSWLPPAGRYPAIQESHDTREASSERIGPGPRLSKQPGAQEESMDVP
jgi:hypothetical protein